MHCAASINAMLAAQDCHPRLSIPEQSPQTNRNPTTDSGVDFRDHWIAPTWVGFS
jgi:hypothetical protein